MVAIIRAAEMRQTETPNAAMTTLASPTQGEARSHSLWTVAMQEGQQGPRHAFDGEQIWYVLSGDVKVSCGQASSVLHAGDVVVLPAGAERQIAAVTAVRMVVCGPSAAVVVASGESRGTPPWIS